MAPSSAADPTATATITGGFNYQTATAASSSSPSSENLSPSILVTVLILATAIIVSASLYLLLRLLSRHFHRHSHPHTDAINTLRSTTTTTHNNRNQIHSRRVSPEEAAATGGGEGGGVSPIDALPIFTFGSINASSSTGGDCAVCLSKFEPEDRLRLLPLCCHAFHSTCIDAWIAANQTCPLCRSPIFASDSEILSKILSTSSIPSGSFRIELGSISRRRLDSVSGIDNRRSYSVGSFDYVIEDAISELTVESVRVPVMDHEKIDVSDVAAEVGGGGGGGRGWLRECAERIAAAASTASLASSFRSSGRFFTGSSRRETAAASGVRNSDLEASRLGDEIGEMFRWLSGV